MTLRSTYDFLVRSHLAAGNIEGAMKFESQTSPRFLGVEFRLATSITALMTTMTPTKMTLTESLSTVPQVIPLAFVDGSQH